MIGTTSTKQSDGSTVITTVFPKITEHKAMDRAQPGTVRDTAKRHLKELIGACEMAANALTISAHDARKKLDAITAQDGKNNQTTMDGVN